MGETVFPTNKVYQSFDTTDHGVVLQAIVNASSAGDNSIVAAVANKKIRVTSINLGPIGSAVTTTWKSDTGGSAVAIDAARAWTQTGAGMSDCWLPHGYFFETAAGKALNLYLSGAVQVSGTINYLLI